MNHSSTTDLKSTAHRLIDELPSNATWEDVMYRMYVQQSIEAGIADGEAGRVLDVEDVQRLLDSKQ